MWRRDLLSLNYLHDLAQGLADRSYDAHGWIATHMLVIRASSCGTVLVNALLAFSGQL